MKNIFFILILLNFESFAQKEGNIWYFGAQAGIDFNSGSPIALTNCSPSFTAFEGVGTLSDTAGNLLFYTDGNNVFNANHVLMPNGDGLLSDISSTQTGLSVKQPGNDSIYYIFHIDLIDYFDLSLYYSVVDMSLNGGLGNVIQKNVLLRNNVTEKATAVGHANGNDVWIITHDSNSDAFQSYLLTAAGLDTIAVISNPGLIHTQDIGYLKASPQGDKLASADFQMNSYALYDFDNATGMVSNANQSPTVYVLAYGCEWSPDGTKLYGGQGDSQNLWQFDVSAGANVWNTATLIYETSSIELEALQLGPDGKIYCSRYQTAWLGIINDPDSAGLACNYVDDGVDLLGRVCQLGLPNYNVSLFNPEVQLVLSNLSSSDSSVCETSCIDFFDLSLGSPDSWMWSFPGGIPSSSTLQNPTSICYNTSGTYDVTLIVTNSIGIDTLMLSNFITVNVAPTALITQSNDTLFSSLANSYQWYLNGQLLPGAISQLYVAMESGLYSVDIVDTNGCTSSAYFFFSYVAFSSTDSTLCEKFCIDYFDQSVNNPVSWQWIFDGAIPASSTAQNPTGICYDDSGTFDVTLITMYGSGNADTLVLIDYISVYTNPFSPVITQTGNTLTATSANSYQWLLNGVEIPGATNQSFEITQSGLYTIVIYNENGCSAQADINATVVGIEEIIFGNVQVYPNPTSGIITCVWGNDIGDTGFSISVLNTVGQQVYSSSEEIFGNLMKINLNDQPSGVYFLQLKNDLHYFHKKIIISR